ncbi:MAG TPA: acyl-CoA dehydrogenase family protein [Acidimicrobiia bacterium]|nr:acyl-CoA dehydrogenase family protein [Acidimicrobiia bacterium]
MDDFREWVQAELKARLAPRRADAPASVLGAGNDDLEAGRAYLQSLAGSGLAVPTWPTEYGGMNATPAQIAIVRGELSAFAVPDLYPYLVGLELIGPTLLAHGTPEQCARWLPKIATGEEIWCQLFSEPGAGSDLAGLSTRVQQFDSEWRATGQKVWTSRGAYSQWGLLLARHDASVRKHEGITAFGISMHAPGVDVRPLRQMNGDAHFSEVFLDDAHVADTDRIGAAGEGWRVALTCLSYERGASAAGGSSGLLDPERLVALARARGRAHEPVVRDALAKLIIETRVMSYTARRARDTAKAGRPGPEGSGMKLRGSQMFRDYTALALDLLGPAGTLDPDGDMQTLFLTAPSLSIRGGTDEIQRNIVGERVLGLPGEPRLDRDRPFQELPKS